MWFKIPKAQEGYRETPPPLPACPALGKQVSNTQFTGIQPSNAHAWPSSSLPCTSVSTLLRAT